MTTKNYNLVKGFIITLCLSGILFVLYEVNKTYALFETNTTSELTEDIAKWIIKVNDENISASNTFNMTDISWSTSIHVKNEKVAPGLNGYFDIEIDPSATEVSIRYDLIYDFTEMENNEFYVNSIQELNENGLVRTGEFTYTGVILLENINNLVHVIRTSLIWNNNENNNEEDSILGSIPNNIVEIPVTINISQYLGEVITPYVEI